MLWNFSLTIGVKERWLIMTAVASLAVVAWHFYFRHAKKHFQHVGHLAFLIYLLLALLFCATESDAFYVTHMDLRPATKKLLLAGASGILVQLAIWLNRLAQGTEPRRGVRAIYLDVFMGFLTGMMGAVAFASTQEFEMVRDQQAVLGGAVGGALGVHLFDLLALRFVPASRENAAATTAGGGSKGIACQYAGQAYTGGAHVTMPDEGGGLVVKNCNGRTGQWVEIPSQPGSQG